MCGGHLGVIQSTCSFSENAISPNATSPDVLGLYPSTAEHNALVKCHGPHAGTWKKKSIVTPKYLAFIVIGF